MEFFVPKAGSNRHAGTRVKVEDRDDGRSRGCYVMGRVPLCSTGDIMHVVFVYFGSHTLLVFHRGR